jgi:serine/threonine-protein kinase
MALQLPARIGKYELEKFLGGGMSHVYRAKDTVIGRTVAVKILTEEGCADAEAKARFLQEARMAGNLEHDNVIAIYDFGEDDQHRPYMVMEFLRGEDLRQAIRGGRVGELADKLRIALQIARAIGFIHEHQIIHRDIKPENIYLTPAGVVKLMDFGIAKTAGLNMTRTGYVMGTPFYMAPEQVTGKNIAEPVDIYAFGVLFFELLVGVRPFAGDTVERIFYSILNEPVDLSPLEQAGVPEPVRTLIARCTAKNPAGRPASFREVAEEIERILREMCGASATVAAAASAAQTPSMPAATSVQAVTGPRAAAVQEEQKEAAPPAAKRWMVFAAGGALLAAMIVGIVLYVSRTQSKAVVEQKPVEATLSPTLSTPTGEMVLVPAGGFLAGQDRHPDNLPAFYVDRTEVTNAAYQQFCQATGHALPADFPAGKAEYPVVDISVEDARQFAQWAGKRLPNGREWEKAARGSQGWPFPWGEAKDASRANVQNSSPGEHQLLPARSFENGASPFGALQMVGNAWELVDEPAQPSPAARDFFSKRLKPPPAPGETWVQMRGESYQEPLVDAAIYDSSPVPARWKGPTIGFRCVKDPPAAK